MTEISRPVTSLKPVAATVEDVRYYDLPEPIQVGNITVSRLLLDPSELKGPTYFKLVSRFRKEYPEEYQNSLVKLTNETFLALVIAELNPPITPEDLQKIPFLDLEYIFLRCKALAFQKGTNPKTA